jgi:hypothetical protein
MECKKEVNFDNVILADLIDLYYRRGLATVISNGKVIGFEKEGKN